MPVTTPTEAAVRVRESREALSLSIRDLASLAAVDHTYLSRFERGQVSPSRRWLREVSEAIGRQLAIVNGDAA